MLTDTDSKAQLHQDWMMREINKLLWPAPQGIGRIDVEQFSREIAVAKRIGNLPNNFSGDFSRLADSSLMDQAVAELQVAGFDIFG